MLRREKTNRLKLWIIAAVVLALAVGWFARSAYRHYKEKHSVSQAQAFLAGGDYRSAYLSVQPALLINSNNVQACSIMARLSDVSQSPAALDWWQRVVNLEPTVENKLALASAGLHYQTPPFSLTLQILNELRPTATNVAGFHTVAAELALRLNRTADAQTQLEAASRLDPTNKQFQMNLAVVRLSSPLPATADAGRATLKGFLADTNFATAALRSLAGERITRKDFAGARDYAAQLNASEQATTGDRLQYLNILRQLHSPELAEQLKFAQRQSGTNATAAAAVASWMIENGDSMNAGRWLTSLATNIQTLAPVRLAMVNSYMAQTNWQGLLDYTYKKGWGDLEFLRLAFASRAWSKLNEPVIANNNWQAAVGEGGGRIEPIKMLLELTGQWGLKREREDLLWQVTRRFPQEKWAEQELERFYYVSGNTRKLNQLYATLFAFSPDDSGIENNLAATSLLLKTNLAQAYGWAGEIYAKKPADPFVASTYAYSLHLQGRTQDGIAALEKLGAESLAQPTVALYYGVLLSAAGKHEKAEYYLTQSQAGGRLLPEEKQLLEMSKKQ